MSVHGLTTRSSRRRATVLVFVIGVLAMLFIIGATQLIVARFDKQSAEQRRSADNLQGVASAAFLPTAAQLREDGVGVDDLPYNNNAYVTKAFGVNFSWTPGETSKVENYADFVGVANFVPATYNAQPDPFKSARSGDFLMSSIEPFWDGSVFRLFSLSLAQNVWAPNSNFPAANGGFQPQVTLGWPCPGDVGGLDYSKGDADGDGVTDSQAITLGISGMYGGQFKLFQRIIPHGGMVMLDRMTHPALLAQVIHPSDVAYHTNPTSLFGYWTPNNTDEARLRRRDMLPGSTKPGTPAYDNLLTSDLRKLLPFSLGYQVPGSQFANMTPHWWPVDNTSGGSNDPETQWWKARIAPMDSSGTYVLNGNNANALMPVSGYSSSRDYYDRRHLMTTKSFDDLFRPQRDEKRLLQYNGTGAAVQPFQLGLAGPSVTSLYYILSPDSAGGTDTFSLDKQGRTSLTTPLAYGMVNGTLQFNKPGLRTPFSLRDTLVPPVGNRGVDSTGAPLVFSLDNTAPWGYQASYQRCVQLMAYYLAVIQHTTVPGTNTVAPAVPTPQELSEQYKTAAQLAVNTIDFADNADVNGDGVVDTFDIRWNTNGDAGGVIDANDVPVDPVTCFTYPDPVNVGQSVQVCGFEKQPFITEAYVKYVHKSVPPVPPATAWTWEASPDTTESIYAVELYNPYSAAMRLDDFVLELGTTVTADLAGITIQPYSYIVLANTVGPGGVSSPFVGALGATLFVPEATNGATAGQTFKLIKGTVFAIDRTMFDSATGLGIRLARKTALRLELVGGQPVARLIIPTQTDATTKVGAEVIVDVMKPSNVGLPNPTYPGSLLNGHALDTRFAADTTTTIAAKGARPVEQVNGTEGDDRLVWDSSLQRRKEAVGASPVHWQFTLSRQVTFPLPWYEHPQNTNPPLPAIGEPLLFTRPTRLAQHNLLGTASWTTPAGDGGLTNQQIVAREMDGVQFVMPSVAAVQTALAAQQPPVTTIDPLPDGRAVAANVVPYRKYPIAPFPLVTSDVGLDGAGRCGAFPTTGTVLLVSRYGNRREFVSPTDTAATDLPISVLATQAPLGRLAIWPDPTSLTPESAFGIPDGSAADGVGQMQMPDNGHLPIFDGPRYNGGVGGQVALGEPRHANMPWGQLVFDYFTALPIEELFQYRNLSSVIAGATNARVIDQYDPTKPLNYENAYSYIVNNNYYPVSDPVSAGGSNTIGPKVRARININFAPWWVLDGLPVLADGGGPVPELTSTALDPATYTASMRVAQRTLEEWMMEDTPTAKANNATYATLGPDMAALLVSYREQRPERGIRVTPYPENPGFTGVGALCDVIPRAPVSSSISGATGLPANTSLGSLGQMTSGVAADKPYSYFGFLQMVAPIVRLQDWVTVKTHVFTVYDVIGDTNAPPVWLRSQATIDRTRCLYTSDLPDRIVQTDPISYFNATGDQPQ